MLFLIFPTYRNSTLFIFIPVSGPNHFMSSTRKDMKVTKHRQAEFT